MPRPKRQLHATVEETLTPPATLSETHVIARITKAAGNNLYNAELPDRTSVLVELEPKFRSTIWIKRGSYVVINRQALADRENKLDGEIVNVVRDEKAWRKMVYWPKEFVKSSSYGEDSEDEESTVGKFPPSDSDDEN
ncbi:nucleic acid-binding protein [Bimuria novae-zelandiae CBS 107.79]|uniref:Nucleic acid-binding protein n=1 Tax=Bimuria novae-zelandiae CBS 107.79 TaxID=1447943 RepID=A0A6A5UYN1_9PLEO|nr:nucleic acid-binding protein [Bimuria novae-zelandiae CBS 107.79]